MAENSTTVVLDQKQVAELQALAPRLLEQAQDFSIVDGDDYLAAGNMLELIDAKKKKVAEFFKEPAKQAAAVHKFITGLRATILQPLESAESLVKNRRIAYRDKEARERREKEEELRKKAKAEQDKQALEEAAAFEEIGDHEAAAVIIDRAATAPAPAVVIPTTIPKEAGHSFRTVWKYRITKPEDVKHEFLSPDKAKIEPVVEQLGKVAVSIVGGIEVFPEEREALRSRSKHGE